MGNNSESKLIQVSKKVHYFIFRKILDSDGKYKSANHYLMDKLNIEDDERESFF